MTNVHYQKASLLAANLKLVFTTLVLTSNSGASFADNCDADGGGGVDACGGRRFFNLRGRL